MAKSSAGAAGAGAAEFPPVNIELTEEERFAAALALTSALPERAFVGEYERLFGTVSDEAAEPEKAG